MDLRFNSCGKALQTILKRVSIKGSCQYTFYNNFEMFWIREVQFFNMDFASMMV